MNPDIPEEQSVKLRPIVKTLLAAFAEIEKRIPMTTDSALIYTPKSGTPLSGDET